MRSVVAGLVLALVATSASAQNVAPDFGAMAKMRQGRAYGEIRASAFIEQFSKGGQAWIAAEMARQNESPRALLDVAMDADKALEKDAKDLKRRYRVHPLDVTRAVAVVIMTNAQAAAAEALKAAQAANDPAVLTAATERLALANANLEAAHSVGSDASRALLEL